MVFNIDEQSGDSGLSFRTLYSVGKKGVKVTEMQFSLILWLFYSVLIKIAQVSNFIQLNWRKQFAV